MVDDLQPRASLNKLHVAGLSAIVIIKIGLIVSVIYLAYTLIEMEHNLKSEINQTQIDLNSLILDNQKQTQDQINELRSSLLTTKEDLTSELSEIKAKSSADFSGVIVEAIKAVVSVGTDISQGSGFIITEDGYIITNAHVLRGGNYVNVLTYGNYEDNKWIPATFIGYNDEMDIAILKISGSHDFLEFESSQNLNIGEKVIAIGNPYGLSFSVTEGIISQLNQEGPNENPAYIQVDTPLNRGNSGGPLIDTGGKVVGVSNFKIEGSDNLGFALESDYTIVTVNDIFDYNNVSVII